VNSDQLPKRNITEHECTALVVGRRSRRSVRYHF
jgi:hypothetical protein